jgi:regulatory protein
LPLITAVIASPKRLGRFDILVDGKHVATLSLEAIERLALHVGASFDERLSIAVSDEARRLRTFDRALTMLAFRARAAREMRQLLLRKGEVAADVDYAIDKLLAMGLLDDAAYARQYALAKITGPGFSRRRLQAELARRGVARDVADSAIADVLADDQVDSVAVLERVAARKLRTLDGLEQRTRRRRLYEFLARRGYDADEIRVVMERLLPAP